MDVKESNKAVLVTGASTGIGKGTALQLDKRGFRVFASVRKQQDADNLKKEASENLMPVIMDVTDERSIARAKEAIEAALDGRELWGLVNNAGISFRAPMECAPIADFRRLFETNVFGLLATTQAFLPLIRQSRGRIVNVSSLTAHWVTPFHGIYSSSKMAITGISEALRMELKPFGVDVVDLVFGGVQSNLWERARKSTEEISSGLSPEFKKLYAEPQQKAFEYFAAKGTKGLLPEQAAEPIIRALTVPKPKRAYYSGPGAKLTKVLDWLLSGTRKDWFKLKSMGLG